MYLYCQNVTFVFFFYWIASELYQYIDCTDSSENKNRMRKNKKFNLPTWTNRDWSVLCTLLRRGLAPDSQLYRTCLPPLGHAGWITSDPSHPGHRPFDLLPSDRRLQSIWTRTSCHMKSFFPSAVGIMNNDLKTVSTTWSVSVTWPSVLFLHLSEFALIIICTHCDNPNLLIPFYFYSLHA